MAASGESVEVAATLAASARGGGGASRRGAAQGEFVGRYVILSELGAGGMGVVYAAYDPELDRKVALKLVLPGGGDEAQTRLVREAQALAKLSHPNVVAVHDVGTVGDRVWLAMEFVEGQTLGEWAGEAPRPWREALALVTSAGRGLAAAHRVGLLHRDFKPDNVMVGRDGRVRVMDFGLARAEGAADLATPDLSDTKSALSVELTRAGSFMGTPAYMAPEQLESAEVTAAADQFAFCVVLWELLYAERPFAGDTLVALSHAVLSGTRRAPPTAARVPAWLRRVCERGLETASERRFPSMDALLAALETERRRARLTRGGLVFAGVAALGVGALGYREHAEAQQRRACADEGASIEEVWNDDRRASVHAAFRATGVNYADATAERVIPWLDEHAQAWSSARAEACVNGSARGSWDGDALTSALWCLESRRVALRTLVEEFERADRQTMQIAIYAASGLSSVEACSDGARLARLGVPPMDRSDRAKAVQVKLSHSEAMSLAGKPDQALVETREAVEEARVIGWTPLVASALAQHGTMLERVGEFAAGRATLQEAYFIAAGAGAGETAVMAATRLTYSHGYRAAEYEDGLLWGELADIELTRAGVPEGDLRRGMLVGNVAAVYAAMGEHEKARALHEEAWEISVRSLGPEHPRVGLSLNNLAIDHAALGDFAGATERYERAIANHTKALGPGHPVLATNYNNLADLLQRTGESARAKELGERACALWEQTYGPEYTNLASCLTIVGRAEFDRGNSERGVALHERALALREKRFGPDHPDLAWNLAGMAAIFVAGGRDEEAARLAERAVRLLTTAKAPRERLAEARFVLARALRTREPARAEALAREAAEGYRSVTGRARELADVERWLAAPREPDPAPEDAVHEPAGP